MIHFLNHTAPPAPIHLPESLSFPINYNFKAQIENSEISKILQPNKVRLTNYTGDLQIEGLAGGKTPLSQANFHKSHSNCKDTISQTKINKRDYSS